MVGNPAVLDGVKVTASKVGRFASIKELKFVAADNGPGLKLLGSVGTLTSLNPILCLRLVVLMKLRAADLNSLASLFQFPPRVTI